jgi:hypothetical protein
MIYELLERPDFIEGMSCEDATEVLANIIGVEDAELFQQDGPTGRVLTDQVLRERFQKFFNDEVAANTEKKAMFVKEKSAALLYYIHRYHDPMKKVRVANASRAFVDKGIVLAKELPYSDFKELFRVDLSPTAGDRLKARELFEFQSGLETLQWLLESTSEPKADFHIPGRINGVVALVCSMWQFKTPWCTRNSSDWNMREALVCELFKWPHLDKNLTRKVKKPRPADVTQKEPCSKKRRASCAAGSALNIDNLSRPLGDPSSTWTEEAPANETKYATAELALEHAPEQSNDQAYKHASRQAVELTPSWQMSAQTSEHAPGDVSTQSYDQAYWHASGQASELMSLQASGHAPGLPCESEDDDGLLFDILGGFTYLPSMSNPADTTDDSSATTADFDPAMPPAGNDPLLSSSGDECVDDDDAEFKSLIL